MSLTKRDPSTLLPDGMVPSAGVLTSRLSLPAQPAAAPAAARACGVRPDASQLFVDLQNLQGGTSLRPIFEQFGRH
jgi:hypothetical protein